MFQIPNKPSNDRRRDSKARNANVMVSLAVIMHIVSRKERGEVEALAAGVDGSCCISVTGGLHENHVSTGQYVGAYAARHISQL